MSTHPKDSSSAAHSHPRPRLVLRVAFAGRRELSPQEHTRLKSALLDVLHTLGHRLAAIAPGIPVDTGNEPRVSKFYEATCPLLRLVTGLCEGADALAGEVLKKVTIHPDPKAGARDTRCLETELAAVLPCDIETYRQSRDPSFHAEFDQQLKRCAWVLELDGKCHKPEPDTPRDKTCRQRAYRAQSAFLLRHCDLLIAAANPDEPGKAGGTLETIQAALAFDLPVILIHTGKDSGNIHPISPENDLHAKLEEPPALPEKCREIISRWVSEIAVDPDSGLSPDEQKKAEGADEGEALLHEYFDETAMPGREAQKPLARFRKWAWDRFEKFFRSGPVPKSDPPLSPYSHYRSRATSLNYHYSAQYRGAFLLNYLFAIVTVTLAAISLALLAQTIGHGEGGFWAAAPPRWLPFVLLALAVSKLLLLTFISKNTRRANQEKWNDRAIDYRYLAERLRGMYYLPRAGSQQPPAAMPLQFASRAVRQSAIDWLFDALVRAISPADLEIAHTREVPSHDGRHKIHVKKVLTINPAEVVESVRKNWIEGQADYHNRNSRTMRALHLWAETVAVLLGWIVIGVVAVDLLIGGTELSGQMPETWETWGRFATPWLIFISAVLPAVVASLNGIRFQSECVRLAERSAVMRVMLTGRRPAKREETEEETPVSLRDKIERIWRMIQIALTPLVGRDSQAPGTHPGRGRYGQAGYFLEKFRMARETPENDLGSWSHDSLRLTERVATDFVQEVAEWSVIYAKEVNDPG